jgi:hypothetical protein
MKRIRVDVGEYRPFERAPGLGFWRWSKKLPLEGDPGKLRVGFWGVGAGLSTNQFQSNFLVLKGTTALFVDLGTKTSLKLAEFGLSVADVKELVVTHSHADHVGGVEELALKRRYEAPLRQAIAEGHALPPAGDGSVFRRAAELRRSGSFRVRLWVPESYANELWEETLRGGMSHSEEVDLGGPRGQMRFEHFFERGPMTKTDAFGRDTWEFSLGEGADRLSVKLFTTPHIPDNAATLADAFFCAGVVLDDRVLVSGDTRFDSDAFQRIAPHMETIFQDCQRWPGGVHAGYDELKSLPPSLRSKMWLYHCDDAMRPVDNQGKLGAVPVEEDGFAGFAEPIPVFYEW